MATPVIYRVGPDVVFSVFRWLTTKQYTVGATTGKLTDHFSGLRIISGYPDDLVAITTPTLALAGPLAAEPYMPHFGTTGREDRFPLSLFGFVVGQGVEPHTERANRDYRDRFFNDVYQLLAGSAGDEGIELYDYATKALIGSIDLVDVRGQILPVNAPEVPADRFRWTIQAESRVDVD